MHARTNAVWADGVKIKKPVRLSAPEYIDKLFDWIESQVWAAVQGVPSPGMPQPCVSPHQCFFYSLPIDLGVRTCIHTVRYTTGWGHHKCIRKLTKRESMTKETYGCPFHVRYLRTEETSWFMTVQLALATCSMLTSTSAKANCGGGFIHVAAMFAQIDDENIFPQQFGAQFPPNYLVSELSDPPISKCWQFDPGRFREIENCVQRVGEEIVARVGNEKWLLLKPHPCGAENTTMHTPLAIIGLTCRIWLRGRGPSPLVKFLPNFLGLLEQSGHELMTCRLVLRCFWNDHHPKLMGCCPNIYWTVRKRQNTVR
eukprot:1158729-Pelagomonas_calceolata.AAC.5